MCEAPRAACRVFCSRSGFPGRCARAGLHGKQRRFGAGDVISGDLVARMPGIQRTLSRVGNPSEASACWDAQGDVKAAVIARGKGRTGKPQTATMAVQKIIK